MIGRLAFVALWLWGVAVAADYPAKTGLSERFEAAPRKMQVFSLFPTGGQRGTAVDVEVLGANLDGLQRIESDCDGVLGDVLSSTFLSARVRLAIAPDSPAKLCQVRMFSRQGASNLEVFRVSELPQQVEREPNNTPETAQHLEIPSLIDGRLYPDEDVDFYAVTAKAGEEITAEIFASRNGSGLNAEMYLLDAAGTRLAIGDNEEGSDPVIRYRFQKDGEYRLAVRGTFGALNISFPTGHPAYVYQLRVTRAVPNLKVVRPFSFTTQQSFPMRVTGERLASVESLIFSDPNMKATIVERSPDEIVAQVNAGPGGAGVRKMWAVAGAVRSTPVNLLVATAGDRRDPEPHHSKERAANLAPGEAVAGQIAAPGDVDFYSFQAPADGLYVAELEAGRFPSMLDPKVEIVDDSGKVLKSADGAPGADVKIERKLKKDEKVYLKVSQSVLNYAGPGYTYRLLVRKGQPTFAISSGSKQPSPKYLAGGDRVYAARGGELALAMKITLKEGFEDTGAPIRLEVEGLPQGVSVESAIVKPDEARREKTEDGKEKKDSPLTAEKNLVFKVDRDAPLTSARIRIRGTARWDGGEVTVYEPVRANAVGGYVLSLSGGSPQQIDCRYLNIIDPVSYELRPEIGDERYPTRFTVRPGSRKPMPITVLSREEKLPEMEFEAENLPRGVRIAGVEAIPDKKQYQLTIEASPDAERGWRPMVIFIARLKPDNTVFTTPYFGMAVQ
jgi:hypothetical protein